MPSDCMIRQRSETGTDSRGSEPAGAGTCDGSTGGGKYCCGSLGPARRGTTSLPGSRIGGAGSSASAVVARSIAIALLPRANILLARIVERRLGALHVAQPRAQRRQSIGAALEGRIGDVGAPGNHALSSLGAVNREERD